MNYVPYIMVIGVFALLARWCWFQGHLARQLAWSCFGIAFFAFVGSLFIETAMPWWARLIAGGAAFFFCFSAQDFLLVMLEKQQNHRAAPIPQGPVQHDFTVSGYQSRGREDDFNIV